MSGCPDMSGRNVRKTPDTVCTQSTWKDVGSKMMNKWREVRDREGHGLHRPPAEGGDTLAASILNGRRESTNKIHSKLLGDDDMSRVGYFINVWEEVLEAPDEDANMPDWKKEMAMDGPPALKPFFAGWPQVTVPDEDEIVLQKPRYWPAGVHQVPVLAETGQSVDKDVDWDAVWEVRSMRALR